MLALTALITLNITVSLLNALVNINRTIIIVSSIRISSLLMFMVDIVVDSMVAFKCKLINYFTITIFNRPCLSALTMRCLYIVIRFGRLNI